MSTDVHDGYSSDDYIEAPITEEEEEYVYDRNRKPAAALDIEAFAQVHIRKKEVPAKRELCENLSALPLTETLAKCSPALVRELDLLRASPDVLIHHTPTHFDLYLRGRASAYGAAELHLRVELSMTYPERPLVIQFLPHSSFSVGDLRPLALLLSKITERLSGPMLIALVTDLRKWLEDNRFRSALAAEDQEKWQRAIDDIAAEKEAERLATERVQEAAQKALLPTFLPLTQEELDQQPPFEGITPTNTLQQNQLPRAMHVTMARTQDKAYFFGGQGPGGSDSDDLYTLDLANLKVGVVSDDATHTQWPRVRIGAVMAAVGKHLYLFDGKDNHKGFVWRFNVDDSKWLYIQLGKSANAMQFRTATPISRRSILLFGGLSISSGPWAQMPTYHNQVHIYSTESNTFKQIETSGNPPPPRYGHSAVLWQQKLIVYGGRSTQLHIDGVWILDTATWHWSGPHGGGLAGRVHHSAVVLGGRMVVFGGEYTEGKPLNELFLFDLYSYESALKPLGSFTDARAGHVALLLGGTMLVVGGAQSEVLFNGRPGRKSGTVEYTVFPAPTAFALAPPAVHVPPSRLLQDLRLMRTEALFSDVAFGPTCLPAHAFLLVARCPQLTTLLEKKKDTNQPSPALSWSPADRTPFSIASLSLPESHVAFLDFIYANDPFSTLGSLTKEVAAELVATSASLSLPALKAMVVSHRVNTLESNTAQLSDDLGRLIAQTQPTCADFALVSQPSHLCCHRAMLASRSAFFRAMLSAGMAEAASGELVLPDGVSPTAASALRYHLYTDQLPPESAEHVLELLPFAAMADLVRLQRVIERTMIDSVDLNDLESVLALLQLAERYKLHALLGRCILLLVQRFSVRVAMKSPAWNTVSADLVARIRKLANE